MKNQATNDRITLHPSFDSEAIAKVREKLLLASFD